jgi:hypothetical protein
VEAAVGGKPVDAGLCGAEVEIGVVIDTVDIEGVSESEDVGADAKVEAAKEWCGKFESGAERAGFDSQSYL